LANCTREKGEAFFPLSIFFNQRFCPLLLLQGVTVVGKFRKNLLQFVEGYAKIADIIGSSTFDKGS
jgi:hypothetical protein